ncbi:MAG: response regulator, partial [Saprospiraceae bacterium]
MITAIIVDDESHCRSSLQTQLKTLGNVDIVASCGNIKEAKEAILRHKPDLLFLDVELSDSTGFELLKSLEDHSFDVIFTTAYDQYALQAIKASALDYLLKPINMADLSQ